MYIAVLTLYKAVILLAILLIIVQVDGCKELVLARIHKFSINHLLLVFVNNLNKQLI